MNNEDWLQDPLEEIGKRAYKRHKLKKPKDDEQDGSWWDFHFATRLKLDGADHFCRQALGAASMPDDLGLPLLAHRQLEWYLGAFFFELMSAYDTLLHELKTVYAYDPAAQLEDVRWDKIKPKLPKTLAEYMEDEWGKDWFCEIRSHRNLATHRYIVPLGSIKGGSGDESLDYNEHTVSIFCIDKTGNIKAENIQVCKDYLTHMAKHIIAVWEIMKKEFKLGSKAK